MLERMSTAKKSPTKKAAQPAASMSKKKPAGKKKPAA